MKSCTLIGCGNMGGTLIWGIRKAYPNIPIYLYDINLQRAKKLAETIQATAVNSLVDAAAGETIILGVKPYQLEELAAELNGAIATKEIISIAAGVDTTVLARWFGSSQIVRFMPNIGAIGGASTTGVTGGTNCSNEFLAEAVEIAQSIGPAYPLEENLFSSFTGMSGSGIAYCLRFLQYLAEGGVTAGLPEETALSMVVDTMKSALVALKETGESPATLIPMITSPKGTTLEGLQALEDGNLKGILADAVERATKRADEIGGKYQ